MSAGSVGERMRITSGGNVVMGNNAGIMYFNVENMYNDFEDFEKFIVKNFSIVPS